MPPAAPGLLQGPIPHLLSWKGPGAPCCSTGGAGAQIWPWGVCRAMARPSPDGSRARKVAKQAGRAAAPEPLVCRNGGKEKKNILPRPTCTQCEANQEVLGKHGAWRGRDGHLPHQRASRIPLQLLFRDLFRGRGEHAKNTTARKCSGTSQKEASRQYAYRLCACSLTADGREGCP